MTADRQAFAQTCTLRVESSDQEHSSGFEDSVACKCASVKMVADAQQ